jgi:hypothetical protein
MLSRALFLAAVAFALGCFRAIPATAQNLEAGKPPSQIFSSTCSLCHKSSRGLLKSVSPGSLPGFLRQHYTTSTDMAASMSAYVLSNGAANAAPGGGNLTRQGQEAAGARPGQEPGPEHAKGRKPPAREAAKPEASDPQAQTERQKAAAERRAARQAAREAAKAAKEGLPPKNEARHQPPKSDQPAEAAKPDAKPEADKAEPSKESEKSDTAKVDGTRPDPVPAVTPAPKEAAKPAEVAVAPPKEDVPAGPLTIDIGPSPAPKPVVSAGPPPVPAGNPIPPISQ